MGSDPQFAKYPDLALAQHIFSLANGPQSAQSTSLNYLQNAVKEHKMAPLYRHLAHPTEGVLNSVGESAAAQATTLPPQKPPARRASLVSSNLLPSKKIVPAGIFPWDESLYEQLKADNDKELEDIQKEEEEAEEKAGETEVQAARSKRADFWARVGDKVSKQASRRAMGTPLICKHRLEWRTHLYRRTKR
jgi:26S proteasome regulatory subunit N7